jgi:acyl carrier protein
VANPPESPADLLSALDRDRRQRPNLGILYVEPVGSVELQLAEIWSEVLRIDLVGRNDDLFSLRGDSLSVVRIMSRIYHRVGVELSLSECFENPTIASLGELIEERIDPEEQEGGQID